MSGWTLKRALPLSMLIGAAVAVPAFGGSASGGGDTCGKVMYRFDEVTRSATVWRTADWPAVGSRWTVALLSRSHRVFASGREGVARGAQRFENEITGQPTPTSSTFKSRAVGYFGNAKVYKTQHGTATLQPDGSLELVGEGRITRGTGVRRGTRVHYSFKGSAASLTDPIVTRVHGAGVYSNRPCS